MIRRMLSSRGSQVSRKLVRSAKIPSPYVLLCPARRCRSRMMSLPPLAGNAPGRLTLARDRRIRVGSGARCGMDALAKIKAEMLPFAELMGIEFTHASPDRVVAELAVRLELCTRPAVLHGGAIMAFA